MTAPRFYGTDDMEVAVRALHARHREVMVLADYKCIRPIRLRTSNRLADLPIDAAWEWKPNVDQHIARFKREGGILMYRTHPGAREPVIPSCDAILFAECPLQWDRFESLCASARQEVVIYRPPMWDLHAQTIDYLYPPREAYQAFEAFLDALVSTPNKRLVCSRFERSVTFKADAVKAMFDWPERQLRYFLLGYKYRVHRWHPYTLRLAPEDPDLRWAWDILASQPRLKPRQHLLKFGAISPRIAGFNSMLKALIKGKYVRADDCLYDARIGVRGKDVDEREAVNNMRRGKWFKLRAFVDDLPEYPLL